MVTMVTLRCRQHGWCSSVAGVLGKYTLRVWLCALCTVRVQYVVFQLHVAARASLKPTSRASSLFRLRAIERGRKRRGGPETESAIGVSLSRHRAVTIRSVWSGALGTVLSARFGPVLPLLGPARSVCDGPAACDGPSRSAGRHAGAWPARAVRRERPTCKETAGSRIDTRPTVPTRRASRADRPTEPRGQTDRQTDSHLSN